MKIIRYSLIFTILFTIVTLFGVVSGEEYISNGYIDPLSISSGDCGLISLGNNFTGTKELSFHLHLPLGANIQNAKVRLWPKDNDVGRLLRVYKENGVLMGEISGTQAAKEFDVTTYVLDAYSSGADHITIRLGLDSVTSSSYRICDSSWYSSVGYHEYPYGADSKRPYLRVVYSGGEKYIGNAVGTIYEAINVGDMTVGAPNYSDGGLRFNGFGSDTTYSTRGYVKFYYDIPENSYIQKAILSGVYWGNPGYPLLVYKTGSSWDEGGFSFTNRPAFGEYLGEFLPSVSYSDASRYELDVTQYVRESGGYYTSFGLMSPVHICNQNFYFYAKEDGATNQRPKLTLYYSTPVIAPDISNLSGQKLANNILTWGATSGGISPYTYKLKINGVEYTSPTNSFDTTGLNLAGGVNHQLSIKAIDAGGQQSPYSGTISFQVTNNPTTPSINISSNQTLAYPFSISLTGATRGLPPYSYTLKIDSTEYAVPAGQTTYSLPNLAGGTNHTIQVKTKDAANQESSYSAPIQFQVTNNPAAPIITSHTQGQTVTGQQTLAWQAPTSGFPPFKYTVKINGVEVQNIVSTTYTPQLQGTVQSIQIKATDSAGMESPYSASISFNVDAPNAPRIISPLEGATVSPNVTLRWEGTTGGVQPYSYKLRLCSDQSCNNVFALGAVNKLVGGEWKYTTPTLPEGQWRIELYAIDANNIASPLAVRYLSVVTVKNSQILKPISNSETTQTPKIEWSQATGGAGGYIYTLRILKGTSWASTKVYEIRIDGLSHTIPSGKLVNGEYYYAMVKAEDKDGFEAVVSEPRGFYVTKTAPTINRPLITAPGATGLSIVGNQTTSISWEGIGQNAVYTMEVARDILFSDILYSVTTTSLSKDIPMNSITTNGKFYVRVRAKVGEEYSQWSIPREIEYRLSLAPTLECTPACKTGEVCTNGVCATPPAVVNEVRGALVEVPKELKQGGAYYIRANLRSTTAATQDKYTVKIYNGATTLYTSTFDMAVTPQGDYKGITIDIPPDLEVPAGTYTIQVTDSKGTVVASAEVPYKSSSNPLDSIRGGDITTIAIVAGCAGLGLVLILVLRQKPKKIKVALRPIKKQFKAHKQTPKPKRKKQKKLNTIKINNHKGARR